MRVYAEFEIGGVPTCASGQVFEDEDGRGIEVVLDGDWPAPARYTAENEVERAYLRQRDAARGGA